MDSTIPDLSDSSQAVLDARMLTDLRQWRRSPRVSEALARGDRAWLDPAEFDLLLRIADERDELRRQACEMPDERPAFYSGLRETPEEARGGDIPLCEICHEPIESDPLSTNGVRHVRRPVGMHAFHAARGITS